MTREGFEPVRVNLGPDSEPNFDERFKKKIDKLKESGAPLAERFSLEDFYLLDGTFFNTGEHHFLELRQVKEASDVERVKALLDEYLDLVKNRSSHQSLKEGEKGGKTVGDRRHEIEQEVGDILDKVE